MEKEKLHDLGKFYASQRSGRGYTQKDVETIGLKKSQISNFENGKNMLSADRLLLAIQGINMSPNEFFHALNGYQGTKMQLFTRQLMEFQASRDSENIKKLIIEEPKSIHEALENVMIKSVVKEITGENLVTSEESSLVGKYLTNIDEWTEYEVAIFAYGIETLDVGDVYWLGKEMIERSEFYMQLVLNRQIIIRTTLHAFAYMIEHGEFKYAQYFNQQLEKMVSERELMDWIFYKFLNMIFDYKTEKTSHLVDEMQKYIDCLDIVGAKVTAQMFTKMLIDVSN
ncbi:Rgg/GadR/MutR family transcriptional regulator [Pseudolactococcus paracarnosus]|uniref:Helix-turn-helix domain-containing protein n=1 Tax=Pseudolactococcus paracarnosus TaxID=2749962 RepID=A0A7L4WFH3_9LACT|nr:Rgg/GadR/MutR family transcriptional regulator [Lactococcus paracarnosus]SPC35278.1 putative Positive transcriptional regulator, MutR family [Lactococcus piscium]MCJ1978404.1 helix-turn-helix domain-containing protein [Lactococcus paracarnosus]MCJ1984547.1 helix-turn-helix domain-containing protein [Lactococcus paracarnosus]MCJ1994619.1 helix-turn-helix domain-containing protein [Lactococcus paracarnosus]MCJ1999226.1 helix-turn-helix domain-containing protein [Lactococcus paracarnosus]